MANGNPRFSLFSLGEVIKEDVEEREVSIESLFSHVTMLHKEDTRILESISNDLGNFVFVESDKTGGMD